MFSLLVYFLVILGVALCVINYYVNGGFGWSYLTSITILYLLYTIFYGFYRKTNHIRKIFVHGAATMIYLGVLDAFTGGKGWSVNYGLPGLLLVLPLRGEALAMESDVRELRRLQGRLPGSKIILEDHGLTSDARCLAQYLADREKNAALVRGEDLSLT